MSEITMLILVILFDLTYYFMPDISKYYYLLDILLFLLNKLVEISQSERALNFIQGFSPALLSTVFMVTFTLESCFSSFNFSPGSYHLFGVERNIDFILLVQNISVRPVFVQRVFVQSFSSNPIRLGQDRLGQDWTKQIGRKQVGPK